MMDIKIIFNRGRWVVKDRRGHYWPCMTREEAEHISQSIQMQARALRCIVAVGGTANRPQGGDSMIKSDCEKWSKKLHKENSVPFQGAGIWCDRHGIPMVFERVYDNNGRTIGDHYLCPDCELDRMRRNEEAYERDLQEGFDGL